MAILGNFTVAQLVTQGLRRGGIVNPSATQITESTDYHLREVIKDIHLFTGGAWQLADETVDSCIVGRTDYPWPTDAHSIMSLVLLDAIDDWRSTATAGTATTITLAAAFSESETTVQGKRIIITGGTGVDQIRQITAYNNSTKVATVPTWTTNPDATSTYAIASYHKKLWDYSKPYHHDLQRAPYTLGIPQYGSMFGRNVWLNFAPDRIYLLWWTYWQDMDRLDVAGTAYLRFLRDYANVIVEGIAAKVMARYDEDRHPNQLAIYNGLLANLAGQNSTVGQVRFNDI